MNPSITIDQAFQLAIRHHQAGRLQQAEHIYRQVLAQQPRHANAMQLLGVLASQLGHHADGESLIRGSIAIAPNVAEAHNNLGKILSSLQRLDEAIAAHRRAIEIKPDLALAYSNLGNALRDQRRLPEAVSACRQALTILPDHPEVQSNLANALRDQGHLNEAVALYRNAIAANPNLYFLHSNLGQALKDQGEIDQAISSFRRAITIKPDAWEAYSNLLLALHYHPDSSGPTLAEEHRTWNRELAQPLAKLIRSHSNNADPNRRLKIGYVSPDFREHPVGQFLEPVLANHDRRQFEIFAYSNVHAPDAMTPRLRAYTDHWINVVPLSDAALAEAIRNDGIDILVDLAMHTAGNRLLAFACKPAPVQVTWLAYPGTSGLATMDYRLSDACLDPPGMDESIYTERTVRLPNSYWCYMPNSIAPEAGAPPVLEQGCITFGCLNNFFKISAETFIAWARILHEVPNSRLRLHALGGLSHQRAAEQMRLQGIDPGRLMFQERIPLSQYLASYSKIDIALDTFPFAGGTTTCDALWMGVPVVSLIGKSAVGRGGFSILSNVRLTELCADSIDLYVQIAVDLARNVPKLQHFRSTLRRRMQQSPLTGAPLFARDIEAVYRRIWHEWCETNADAHRKS